MIAKIKKWEVRQRVAEIEKFLYWRGNVGRQDLVDKFGISLQQASTDLKLYFEKAKGMATYRGPLRKFVPTDTFEPFEVKGTIDEYESWSAQGDNFVERVPMPFRKVSPEILKSVSQAIHQNQSLEISYRSLSTPGGSVRRISPHSIVKTAARYHVRAYCHTKQEFRDFVLGRFLTAGAPDQQGKAKSHDADWNTLVVARIGPHNKLTQGQRKVIEGDFDMHNGVAELRIRLALLFYFLDQFSLRGSENSKSGTKQQIVLLNPEILSIGLN